MHRTLRTPVPVSGRRPGLYRRGLAVAALFVGFLAMVLGSPRAASAYPGERPIVYSAVANSPGMITIAWTHSGDADLIQVKRDGAPDFGYLDRSAGASGTHIDTFLQPDTLYTYFVCAVQDDDSFCSDAKAVRTQKAPAAGQSYSPPYITSVIAATNSYTVTWAASQSYQFYQLIYGEQPTAGGQIKHGYGGSTGTYTVPGLRPGSTHHFGLQGCTYGALGNQCSQFTAPIFVTTLATPPAPRATPPPPPPATPTNLRVRINDSAQLVLGWTPNITDNSPEVEYDIYRGGKRVKTQGAYPFVENKYHGTPLASLEQAIYKVCAVHHRGTAAQAQSCTADLTVRSAWLDTPVHTPAPGSLPSVPRWL